MEHEKAFDKIYGKEKMFPLIMTKFFNYLSLSCKVNDIFIIKQKAQKNKILGFLGIITNDYTLS